MVVIEKKKRNGPRMKEVSRRRKDSADRVYQDYVADLKSIMPSVVRVIGPELAPSLMDEGTSDEASDQIVDVADRIVRALQKRGQAERDRLVRRS